MDSLPSATRTSSRAASFSPASTSACFSAIATAGSGTDYPGCPEFVNDGFDGARPLPCPFFVAAPTVHVEARINMKNWGGLYITANLSLGFRAEFQGSRRTGVD